MINPVSLQFTRLTRNVNSDKAKAIADMGAEVVTVDIDNDDSLKKAFEGAYGVYAVTFSGNTFPRKKKQHRWHQLQKLQRKTNSTCCLVYT